MLRFDSGFEFFSRSDLASIIYLLGDDIKQATPKAHMTGNTGVTLNLDFDVSGSGMLKTIFTAMDVSDYLKVEIDGVVVMPSANAHLLINESVITCNLPFTTSLKIYSRDGELGVSYELD